MPAFAVFRLTGLAPFLLLFPCFVTRTCHHSRLFGPLGWGLLLLFPCLAAFTCLRLRLFGPPGWCLSFCCSCRASWREKDFSLALLLLPATICAYLAHWAGSCPSLALSFALSWLLLCHFVRFLFVPPGLVPLSLCSSALGICIVIVFLASGSEQPL